MNGLMTYAADLAATEAGVRHALGIPDEAIRAVEAAAATRERRAQFVDVLRERHSFYFAAFGASAWGYVSSLASVAHNHELTGCGVYGNYMQPFMAFAATDGWASVYECLAIAMRAWDAEREDLLNRR